MRGLLLHFKHQFWLLNCNSRPQSPNCQDCFHCCLQTGFVRDNDVTVEIVEITGFGLIVTIKESRTMVGRRRVRQFSGVGHLFIGASISFIWHTRILCLYGSLLQTKFFLHESHPLVRSRFLASETIYVRVMTETRLGQARRWLIKFDKQVLSTRMPGYMLTGAQFPPNRSAHEQTTSSAVLMKHVLFRRLCSRRQHHRKHEGRYHPHLHPIRFSDIASRPQLPSAVITDVLIYAHFFLCTTRPNRPSPLKSRVLKPLELERMSKNCRRTRHILVKYPH